MTGESTLRDEMHDPELWPQGTVTFVEPGRGTGNGHPDTFILVAPSYWPLELKGDGYGPDLLRPEQRRWHKLNVINGGRSFVLDRCGELNRLVELNRELQSARTVTWKGRSNYNTFVSFLVSLGKITVSRSYLGT